MTAPGLVVENLVHRFRTHGASRFSRRASWRTVLDDVSFAVPPGTLTAIVGASGCGKSTLLRILAGLESPVSGTASIDGTPLVGRPGRAAYQPQQDALLPWLTALDNATLGAEISGQSRDIARQRARDLLERFGLVGVERAWPGELSGGMRQRVALLRSTLMPQRTLLLDEPFGALDALTRRRLQRWLLTVMDDDQRPTVLITHDVDEAVLLADQVLVLSEAPARIIHAERRPDSAQRRAERADGSDRVAVERILAALEGDGALIPSGRPSSGR